MLEAVYHSPRVVFYMTAHTPNHIFFTPATGPYVPLQKLKVFSGECKNPDFAHQKDCPLGQAYSALSAITRGPGHLVS